jgi:hypothetical protein
VSYSIDSNEYLSGRLSISLGDWRRLANELSDDLPERTFLNEQTPPQGDDSVIVPIVKFWWYGEGAGYESEELFKKKVAPFLIGEADILLVWEGGDSHTGWRIIDGKVTDCKVVSSLVPIEQREVMP